MKKLTLIALIAGLTSIPFSAVSAESFSYAVDDKGNITLPDDFRKNMAHLGSWFVPSGGASGFHDVYLDKDAVDEYRKTGKYPDGAVMVKELRASKSADYTTGPGVSYATGELKQTFVMVKDSQNRFAEENKSWGDGWGWALIKAGDTKNSSTNYKNDCLGCHVPAQNNDWIYIEAYPTLSK